MKRALWFPVMAALGVVMPSFAQTLDQQLAIEQYAPIGAEIFFQLEQRGEATANVEGQGAGDVTHLNLYFTQTSWDQLSKANQVAITYYAESLIPEVQENPQDWVEMPPIAPAYQDDMNKMQQICSGCWIVEIGERNEKGTVIPDITPVAGDQLIKDQGWTHITPASEFRQSVVPE